MTERLRFNSRGSRHCVCVCVCEPVCICLFVCVVLTSLKGPGTDLDLETSRVFTNRGHNGGFRAICEFRVLFWLLGLY